jgi:uncharacterized protein YjbI with pentapeptide repeats
VLGAFAIMFLLTGGVPSGLAVGLTVAVSGAFVTWSEQHRLTKRHRISRQVFSKPLEETGEVFIGTLVNEAENLKSLDSSEETAQEWIEQYIPEGISPNKTAILRVKLAQLTSETTTSEQIQSLVNTIENAEDYFFTLAALVGLDPLTDFAGCNLQKVNFSPSVTKLIRDLRETNPIMPYLRGANLNGVDLREANLNGANLIRANLREANLNGAKLITAYLIEANLNDAYLTGAVLRGADLREANLSEANLRGADLREANLSEANLIEADLREAEVKNTRFMGSIGISPELKHDLEERGAIFEDFPGDRGRVLVPH